jgi:hypothetical protein
LDYKNKVMQFARLGRDVLEFKVKRIKERKFLIARTKTQKMLEKGCQGHVAYLFKPKDQCTLESTAVVKKFQNVFLTELTSFLLP